MSRFIDITGKKFGELVVVEKAHHNKWGGLLWKAQCSCGNVVYKLGHQLKKLTSCGCKTKEKMSLARIGKPSTARKAYGVATFNILRRRYVYRAQEKGLDYDMSDAFLKETFAKDCYYCGSEPQSIMRTKETYGEYIYNGLDRIDSSLGYTEDNVVPCCSRCNQMKNDMTLEEFSTKINELYTRKANWGAVL